MNESHSHITWLNQKLIFKIKEVFEPRYGRSLTISEVEEIADNLTDLLTFILKINKDQYEQ